MGWSARGARDDGHHQSINDIIARALTLANVPTIREHSGIVWEDNKRPDGMTNNYTCPDHSSTITSPCHWEWGRDSSQGVLNRRRWQSTSLWPPTSHFICIHCHQDTRSLGPVGPDAKTFLFELGKETEAADMRAKIHILPPTKNLRAWPFNRGVQWPSWDQYHRKRSWINCLSYLLTILVVYYTYYTL